MLRLHHYLVSPYLYTKPEENAPYAGSVGLFCLICRDNFVYSSEALVVFMVKEFPCRGKGVVESGF